MTNTMLLEELIREAGLKKKYIAQRMGISPYSLAKKIRNESEFTSGQIDIFCDILKIKSPVRKCEIFLAKM